MLNTMNTLLSTAQGLAQKDFEFWQSEEQQYRVPGRITGISSVDLGYQPDFVQQRQENATANAGRQRLEELRRKRDQAPVQPNSFGAL